jgi:hypothetical protein
MIKENSVLYSKILIFLVGGMLSASLIGPLIGLVQILRSPSLVVKQEKEALSSQIVDGVLGRNEVRSGPGEMSVPPNSGCEIMLFKISQGVDIRAKLAMYYYHEIEDEEVKKQIAILNKVGLDRITDLSLHQLGALNGCLERSLLAPLCRKFVSNIIQKPVSPAEKLLRDTSMKEVGTAADQLRCEAVKFLNQ